MCHRDAAMPDCAMSEGGRMLVRAKTLPLTGPGHIVNAGRRLPTCGGPGIAHFLIRLMPGSIPSESRHGFTTVQKGARVHYRRKK